jgi:predicted dehydrogenase
MLTIRGLGLKTIQLQCDGFSHHPDTCHMTCEVILSKFGRYWQSPPPDWYWVKNHDGSLIVYCPTHKADVLAYMFRSPRSKVVMPRLKHSDSWIHFWLRLIGLATIIGLIISTRC